MEINSSPKGAAEGGNKAGASRAPVAIGRHEAEASTARPPLPLTVITGFLGSGKTTLVKHLLQSGRQKFLLLQSDFTTEMGIETTEFRGPDGQLIPEAYELPNGCICCSARDGVIATLDLVLGRPDPPPVDYVLVEASGVADPCRLIESFWLDDELCTTVFLDGIVALVDCENFFKYLGERSSALSPAPALGCAGSGSAESSSASAVQLNAQLLGQNWAAETGDAARNSPPDYGAEMAAIAAKQVAAASVVILNRTDRVSPAQTAAVAVAVERWNAAAPRLPAVRAGVAVDALLHRRAFAASAVLAALAAEATRGACVPDRAGHALADGHGVASRLFTMQTRLTPAVEKELFHSGQFQPAASCEKAAASAQRSFEPQEPEAPEDTCVHNGTTGAVEAELEKSLGRIVWGGLAGNLFRYKAFLLVGRTLWTLQGVGDTFEFRRVPAEGLRAALEKNGTLIESADGDKLFVNRFLAVGRELNGNILQQWLEDALAGTAISKSAGENAIVGTEKNDT